MLTFESVERVYDDGTRAVDDVSLSIQPGEICVLLGPSGAGKSTLMNMVNGVVEPTSGKVTLGDLELNKKNMANIQRQIGMIHQQLHLVPRLSVLHNVLAGLLPQTNFWRSLIKSFQKETQRNAC
jgi:phosphonate transport system ATP-binding protein